MPKSFYQCTGCGSKLTDSQLAVAKQADPKLISCCPDRNLALMTDNHHSLYQSKDFTPEERDRNCPLYRNVVEGGLAVCKICGDYEAGLDDPCKGRPLPHNHTINGMR